MGVCCWLRLFRADRSSVSKHLPKCRSANLKPLNPTEFDTEMRRVEVHHTFQLAPSVKQDYQTMGGIYFHRMASRKGLPVHVIPKNNLKIFKTIFSGENCPKLKFELLLVHNEFQGS